MALTKAAQEKKKGGGGGDGGWRPRNKRYEEGAEWAVTAL